jgi:subtilisin family serine protease
MMREFQPHSLARFVFVVFTLVALAACAKSEEKPFLPVVAKVGAEVTAISREDAETICRANYCEENQLYTADFGRRHHDDPPPPPVTAPVREPGVSPTTPPYAVPAQPSEQFDYSRGILNVQDAWAYSEGSTDVIVAVIDSGVDYFHPDLKNNIAVDAPSAPGYSGDTYGYDFYHKRPNGYDDNGHGTHCSGIIAAAKNGIGIRGIAPRVKILPVKFLGPTGSGDTADAVAAIDYAVARGARVLSNSWGGGGYSQLLDDAIQRAVNRGVIFVAAAGNNATDNDSVANYPANYANVISVGSSDGSDSRSSFSNYGRSSVEVFAPGTSIYSTFPGGQYRSMSGTSMAAPQVSGALALAVSVRPSISRAEATADLCDTSLRTLSDFSKCGRMDVGAYIRRVAQ